MSELEQQKLARLFNSKMVIWWAPDEDTCRQIVSVSMRKVEMGLCANFAGGQYVALDGCDPSDFIVGNRLSEMLTPLNRNCAHNKELIEDGQGFLVCPDCGRYGEDC